MGDFEKTIEILRKQRHDFMNDLQIIYGYIQVGKENKAKEVIEKLSVYNEIISELYNLGDSLFAYNLEQNIIGMFRKDIGITVNIEISKFKKRLLHNEKDKKINLVNNIFNKIEEKKHKNIHIYIFEDKLGESLFISNNEELTDEINWMESWDKLYIEIEDISVYRCIYGDNIAYRIIFCK